MAKAPEDTIDSIEQEARDLVSALNTDGGKKLLDTIETKVTDWVDIMLDPKTSPEVVLAFRQRILGVLEFVTVWGSSRSVAESIGKRALRKALNMDM
jgi:hypothetical protein